MSVSSELQLLIRTVLTADPVVAGLIDGRIYDGRPDSGQFPCITFGPTDTVPQDMEGIVGREEAVQLDVWSRDKGSLRHCKSIVDAVKSALHLAELSLATNALIKIEVVRMRVFVDRDGITAHGVITIEADLEEADGPGA